MRDYVIYEDTDSVVDTEIQVNGASCLLSKLFEISDEYEYHDDFNEKYVKRVNGKKTLSFNILNKCIEYKNIKYVMKHRVQKDMYKIKWNGKEIIVTEDHSIIIDRNGDIFEVSPKNIENGDKIIGIL